MNRDSDGGRSESGRDGRSGDPVTAELWVWADRDCLDADCDLSIDRAAALADRGVFGSFRLREWAHQADCTPLGSGRGSTPEDRAVQRCLADCDRWASERGVELPLPPARRGGVGRMGPEVVLRDLPMVLLVEYRGDAVVSVVPCAAGGRGYSVEERLRRLADAGRWVPPTVDDRRGLPPVRAWDRLGRGRGSRDRSDRGRGSRDRRDRGRGDRDRRDRASQ